MAILVLPDPCLVLLVGPAGAGKSTFAGRHFAADETLSSDAMRAVVGRDEGDQDATRPAFALLERQLGRRLAAGRLTVVDATNVERHARRSLLRKARLAGLPVIAIVFDLPPAIVLARNQRRPTRVVDPEVVRRHVRALRRAIDRGDLESEGFAIVYRLRQPREIDAVGIVRERGAAPGRRAVRRARRGE